MLGVVPAPFPENGEQQLSVHRVESLLDIDQKNILILELILAVKTLGDEADVLGSGLIGLETRLVVPGREDVLVLFFLQSVQQGLLHDLANVGPDSDWPDVIESPLSETFVL